MVDQNGIVQCNRCTKTFVSGGPTTNLIYHVERFISLKRMVNNSKSFQDCAVLYFVW
jgi:hypothetical protein